MPNSAGRDDDLELDGVDLPTLRADDALLDALGGSDPKVAAALGDAELNALLLSWSREVDGEPMPELVDVDTAVSTIKAATNARRRDGRERRHRLLIPVAAAASVLAITFGGASVAAADAQPGDTLWGLTKVLYAEKANSVQASFDVRATFKRARDAMTQGELDAARDALNQAEVTLRSVRDEENHDGLSDEHRELMIQLETSDEPPIESEEDSKDPAVEDDERSSSSTTTSPPTSSTDPHVPEPLPDDSEPSDPPSSPSTEPSSPPSSTSSNEASPSGSSSRSGVDTDADAPPTGGGVSENTATGEG